MQEYKRLFDLCSFSAGAKIFANKICAATASLESLLEKKSPGYVGSFMISPPVSILVKFPGPRRLHGIGILPNVGDNRVEGLRVYVCSSNWMEDKNSISGLNGETLLRHVRYSGKKAADVTLSDCAVSPTWIHLRPSRLSDLDQLPDSVVCSQVRSNTTRSARVVETYLQRNVSIVLIDICSTHRRTRPSLRRLELWGEDEERVVVAPSKPLSAPSIAEDVIDLTADPKEPVTIPEEFLDPITSDLMRWPMLLPSGHVVDKATLEQWHVARGSLTSANTDPFTLLPFTAARRPQFHGLLKARIDQFLSEHPQTGGQTAGSSSKKRSAAGDPPEAGSSKTARVGEAAPAASYPYNYSYRSVDLLGTAVKRCARCSRPLLTSETLTEQAFRTPCDVTLCRSCARDVADGSSLCQRCGLRHSFASIRRVFD